MSRPMLSTSAALVAALLVVADLPAQTGGRSMSRGGSTSSGLFGQRTVGGAQSRNAASNLFGGGGGARGGQGPGFTQNATANDRFSATSRNAAQSFVGADTGEVRAVGIAGGAAAAQGQQQFRGLQDAFSQFRQFNQRDAFNQNAFGQQARVPVRVTLQLGFTPTAPAPAQVSTVLSRRLAQLPGVQLVGTPEVLLDGRIAVVLGTAASERDRELVSRLLLLEPGVSAVRNEMSVAQAGSAGSTPNSPPAVDQPEPPPAPPQF